MSKIFVKILSVLGAVLGVGFVVLFSLENFNVPVVDAIQSVAWGVYLVAAFAVLCVICFVLACVLTILNKKKESKYTTVVSDRTPDRTPLDQMPEIETVSKDSPAPDAQDDATDIPAEPEKATDVSDTPWTFYDSASSIAQESTLESVCRPDAEQQTAAQDLFDREQAAYRSENEYAQNNEYTQNTAEEEEDEPADFYEIPAVPQVKTARQQKAEDWLEATRILDEELSTDDVSYTGNKIDDKLDLDPEFIVKSQDEAVLPNKALPPTKDSAAKKSKENEIIGHIQDMINEIYAIVGETEGKKDE